jgi:hypothetical protein
MAVSANGDIHVLMTEHMMGGDEYQKLAYTRSEDGGLNWLSPVVIDSVTSQVATITASPGGKVAIVYLNPTDQNTYSVIKNDVHYFESLDGRTWDFGFPKPGQHHRLPERQPGYFLPLGTGRGVR